ncbi:MAG: flavodoxin family protein [Deltaproteobacteria bacterium]|jgi:multimeric flavodoxin WrbA|nr:flavodoxin family protein [Deltaproteobacteria bacterium]
MAKIMAFSGTPIKNGNIEQGIMAVLGATGQDYEFVRLSEINLKACRACKGCVKTNRCVIDDDVNPLLDKIDKAEALVMSGYPSFGSVNALTKIFVERNWPLRHRTILTQGKVGAAVVCGRSGLDKLADWFGNYFTGYLKTRYQGTLALGGNVPCLSCGFGEDCPGRGFLGQYGPGAKITPDKFSVFSKNLAAQAEAENLGRAIAKAIGAG